MNFIRFYNQSGDTEKAKSLHDYLCEISMPTANEKQKKLNRFRWLYRDIVAGQYRNIGETRALLKSILRHDTETSFVLLLFQIFTVRVSLEMLQLTEMMPYLDKFNRVIADEIVKIHPDLDVSPLHRPIELRHTIADNYRNIPHYK
ncbi:MAG: hypothetical protein Q4G63_09975 [Bacteroidia bacterium]|nr:hypothetical protein [Bacteroidia bacterium]